MKKTSPKKQPPGTMQKVRNRLHLNEVYYTFSNWELKDIDGIKFIPVIKVPDVARAQRVHYVKKDNMEYIK